MTNTEAIIFLVSFIGFFVPLLIYGILKLTKRNLDNHKNIDIFLALVMFISGITLGTFFMIVPAAMYGRQEEAIKSAKNEKILKEANLSDLQNYIINELGAGDIAYNKEAKKVIIDTSESSYAENIAKIDKRLAKNANIKSVEFTRADGKGGPLILIINLK